MTGIAGCYVVVVLACEGLCTLLLMTSSSSKASSVGAQPPVLSLNGVLMKVFHNHASARMTPCAKVCLLQLGVVELLLPIKLICGFALGVCLHNLTLATMWAGVVDTCS